MWVKILSHNNPRENIYTWFHIDYKEGSVRTIIYLTYICLPKSGSFSTVNSFTLGKETEPMLRQQKLKIKH